MKVVFAGTPEFAAIALKALLEAGFDVPLVLTQPDRPAGRGMKMQASAVKQVALKNGISVAQPTSLRLDGKYPEEAQDAYEKIKAVDCDVMVVVAYGLILPRPALAIPRHGCINIHASLLPRWRGAAPIQRAIEAGDKETGVTIMQMDEGLDTGPMLASAQIPIFERDTATSLHDKLAELGGRMIVSVLRDLEQGALKPVPQPEKGVTYAAKIMKQEAALDFSLPAGEVVRKIRAFNPFPGCAAQFDGVAVKIWRAEVVDVPVAGTAGTVLEANSQDGILVACGEGGVRLVELQKPGSKRLPVAEFIKGFDMTGGHFD